MTIARILDLAKKVNGTPTLTISQFGSISAVAGGITKTGSDVDSVLASLQADLEAALAAKISDAAAALAALRAT